MASIRGRDTKPELILWSLLDHRRLRRHPKILGNPDIGNRSRGVAIFVDGCFWHGCPRCYKAPNTRAEYWSLKLRRNVGHDKAVTSELEEKGFKVLRFWEHLILEDAPACAAKIMESFG